MEAELVEVAGEIKDKKKQILDYIVSTGKSETQLLVGKDDVLKELKEELKELKEELKRKEEKEILLLKQHTQQGQSSSRAMDAISRPQPLVRSLSDPDYIAELRKQTGYLPRLHGLGGTVHKVSDGGEGNTGSFEGIQFQDAGSIYSPREMTIANILKRLQQISFLLVRSPPMAGKTALAQLLEKKLLELLEEKEKGKFRVFRLSMLWMHIGAAEDWDFQRRFMQLFCISWRDFLEECRKIDTYLICDEIQMLYCPTVGESPAHGGQAFWDIIKYCTQTNSLRILAFATYGYRAASHITPSATVNISPYVLNKRHLLTLKDILYAKTEFDDYVARYCRTYLLMDESEIVSLQVFLQNLTNRHAGITSFCLSLIHQSFVASIKRGELNMKRVFALFHSPDFLLDMKQCMRAYTRCKFLLEEERALCDKVLQSSDERGVQLLSDEQDRPHQRLLSINILVENDGYIDFFAPIIRSLYILDRFGGTARPSSPPESFQKFILNVISLFNPDTLKNSFGRGKDGRLYERVYQMEFYRAALQVLPSTSHISPDTGATFSSKGFVDFYILKNGPNEERKRWVVEMLRDGNRRNEHLERFKKNGRYHPIIAEADEWIVLDILGPGFKGNTTLNEGLCVVEIDHDYQGAKVCFSREDVAHINFI